MSSLIRMVIDFVMSHTFLILQLSLDLFLIVLLILTIRRRKAKKEREMLFFREQESRRLTKRISNPAYLEREGIQFGRSYPYKVHDGGALPAEQGGKEARRIGEGGGKPRTLFKYRAKICKGEETIRSVLIIRMLWNTSAAFSATAASCAWSL